VVDYDNTRDYRLFVPLNDGRIVAWDAFGKPVTGWQFKDTEAPVISKIEHIRVRSKDYILAVNQKGKIHLLDRRGNARHKVEATLPEGFMMPYGIEIPDQVIESGAVHVVHPDGVLYRVGFDGRSTRLDPGIKPPRSVAFADFDSDRMPDALMQLKGGAMVVNAEGKKLADFSQGSLRVPFYLLSANGTVLSAAISDEVDKVYLFTANGKLVEGFPLIGNVQPVIGDMNADGNYQFVTGMDEGLVYGYALQQNW